MIFTQNNWANSNLNFLIWIYEFEEQLSTKSTSLSVGGKSNIYSKRDVPLYFTSDTELLCCLLFVL